MAPKRKIKVVLGTTTPAGAGPLMTSLILTTSTQRLTKAS